MIRTVNLTNAMSSLEDDSDEQNLRQSLTEIGKYLLGEAIEKSY